MSVKFSLFTSLIVSRFVQGTVQRYEVIIHYNAVAFPLIQSHNIFTTLTLCQEDIIIDRGLNNHPIYSFSLLKELTDWLTWNCAAII